MVKFLFFLDLTDLLPIDQLIDKCRDSFPWKLWTNLAFQWQVWLGGWPDGLYPVPDSLFKVEETKNHECKELSQPIIDGSDQQVTIMRWTPSKCSMYTSFSINANQDLRGT
jgi:hypothetical protein